MKRSAIPALRAAYDAQQASLVRWLTDVLPDAWDERSVLSEWTVRELAFHTTEVPGALTRALEGGPVRERALTVAEYTAAWRAASADIAARDRKGAEGCTSADVIARHRSEHAVLAAALDELENDPVVRARRGPIRVSDFLATRVNELVVHARDLSASVPSVPAVELNNDALGVSVRMLLDILVERAPGRSVEVRVPPYAAVQKGHDTRAANHRTSWRATRCCGSK